MKGLGRLISTLLKGSSGEVDVHQVAAISLFSWRQLALGDNKTRNTNRDRIKAEKGRTESSQTFGKFSPGDGH
jgi:hypothetical protein